MAYFVLTMVNGPHYDRGRARREQVGWDEHAAFMDGLAEAGFVLLGDPIGDGQLRPWTIWLDGRPQPTGPAARG